MALISYLYWLRFWSYIFSRALQPKLNLNEARISKIILWWATLFLSTFLWSPACRHHTCTAQLSRAPLKNWRACHAQTLLCWTFRCTAESGFRRQWYWWSQWRPRSPISTRTMTVSRGNLGSGLWHVGGGQPNKVPKFFKNLAIFYVPRPQHFQKSPLHRKKEEDKLGVWDS